MTQIFSDGFESDDFSAWTGTTYSGGTVTVGDSWKHHGNYGIQSHLDGGVTGTTGHAKVHKTVSGTHLFAREIFKIDNEPLYEDGALRGRVISFSQTSTGTGCAYAGVGFSGGVLKFGMLYRNGGAFVTVFGSSASLNTEYTIELEVLQSTVGNSDGAQRLYVNGVLDIEITGIDNDDRPMNYFNAGLFNSGTDSAEPVNVFIDCVVVADAYIGLEASKLAYTAGSGQSIDVGSVSDVITVQVQDINGTPVTTGAAVSLSTSSAGGAFYSDSQGNTQITSVAISSGQSSADFYYKDTSAGTPTLTASSTGLTSAVTEFSVSQSGGQFISSIAEGAPFTVSDGALSLNVSSPTQVSGGVVSMSQANGSTNGYLASTDWNTFNNKQNVLTVGNLNGTDNQVSVVGGAGAVIGSGVILSLPQSIHTGASPTFAGLTVSGAGIADLNVTSLLTLNGNAGNSGQVLTSNGSGNAPTWQTVSGGPDFITSIAQGQPFNVSSGALSLTPFAHSYISDWSTATSAFLTTVTPSNLSGSGAILSGWTVPWSQVTDAPSFLTTVTPSNLSGSGWIPSGWLIDGPQVYGNISGNAASITGTIPWSKVTSAPNFLTTVTPSNLSGSGAIADGWTVPWSKVTGAPSFVTSGSAVQFSEVTLSGTISGTVGVVTVFGSLSISGTMTGAINLHDDGFLTQKDNGYSLNWIPEGDWGYTEPIQVLNPPTGNYINVFCSTVNPIATWNGSSWVHAATPINPHLYVDKGIFVQKDVMTFGAIMTYSDPQNGPDHTGGTGGAAIMMGHGFDGITDPPMIVLSDSYLGQTTLSLRQGDNYDISGTLHTGYYPNPAHLDLGNLYFHGNLLSQTNGNGYYSYQACHDNNGVSGGNNGGIALDAYGNVYFQGGSASNSWHVFNMYGYDMFSIKNNPNGTTYGNIDIHLNPYQDRTWALGSASLRWAGLCAWDIYFANQHDQWDSIDDLAYAKQFKGKTITDNKGRQRTIIDPDTLKIFKVDYDPNDPNHHDKNKVEEMHDLHKVVGFMLCAHKASAQKHDQHDTKFETLLREVEDLRSQIKQLTNSQR